MNDSLYSIGELARISGVAVRRIRFYSDEGLLPPTSRTSSNYRIYSDADVARLQLIRTLRDTGVSMETIRSLLARRLSIRNVLELRLESLEAELVAKQRIANCLRATLQCDTPTEADFRRLWNMTTLTQTQLQDTLRGVIDAVSKGTTLDAGWKERMIQAGMPELPNNPTPQQIDAWNEITAMITDKTYIEQMQADTHTMWQADFDPAAYAKAADTTFAKIREAIARRDEPASAVGLAIAKDWLEASARAMKKEPNEAFLQWHLDQYRKHHARSTRYQELLAILRGEDPSNATGSEWLWINRA